MLKIGTGGIAITLPQDILLVLRQARCQDTSLRHALKKRCFSFAFN